MRGRTAIVTSLMLLAGITVVLTKGITTKIVVAGGDLAAPIELRERDVIAPFNVWSGPGTSMNGVEGVDGFIVDWRAGAVDPPLAQLQQFEISFYADHSPSSSSSPVYVVSYGIDRSNGEGYVYLPGRSDPRWGANVRSIIRGPQYEGHWFRAAEAWQSVMRTYVIPNAARRP
jgi:hypothetical protein